MSRTSVLRSACCCPCCRLTLPEWWKPRSSSGCRDPTLVEPRAPTTSTTSTCSGTPMSGECGFSLIKGLRVLKVIIFLSATRSWIASSRPPSSGSPHIWIAPVLCSPLVPFYSISRHLDRIPFTYCFWLLWPNPIRSWSASAALGGHSVLGDIQSSIVVVLRNGSSLTTRASSYSVLLSCFLSCWNQYHSVPLQQPSDVLCVCVCVFYPSINRRFPHALSHR